MSRPLADPGSLSRRLAAGLAWGLIVTAAEASSQPLDVTPLATQVLISGALACGFSASGCVLALTIPPLAARVRLPVLIAAFVLICAALAAVMTVSLALFNRFTSSPSALFGPDPDLAGMFTHTLFPHLFFGGLAFIAYLLMRRGERTRSFIARSMIAAAQAETAEARASARGLRGQLRPQRIAQFLIEIRKRYRLDLAEGDRLLEQLTEFLRAAMPAVRTGRSTLGAELTTLNHYHRMAMRAQTPPPPWRIGTTPRALPDAPFPPLLLLQAVEALPRAMTPPVELHCVREAGETVLRITDPFARLKPGWLATDLVDQLRLALRALYGDRVSVTALGGSTPMEVRFTASRAVSGALAG